MEIEQTATQRAQFRDVYNGVVARQSAIAAMLPNVRALAEQSGAVRALPTPPVARPALPSTALAPIPDDAPLQFAAHVERYRAAGRDSREQAGRAALQAWLESQQEVVND